MATVSASPRIFVKEWLGRRVRINRPFIEGFRIHPKLSDAAKISAAALLEKGNLTQPQKDLLKVASGPAAIIEVELTPEAQEILNVHGSRQTLADIIPKINIYNCDMQTQEERPQEEYSAAREREYSQAFRLGRKLLISLSAMTAAAVTGLEMGSDNFRIFTSFLNKELFNNSEMFLSLTSSQNSYIPLLLAAGLGAASFVYGRAFGSVYGANAEAKATYDLLAALNPQEPTSSKKA